MYKILRNLIFMGLALATLSCNDDFLKQNELPLYAFPDPLMLSADQPVSAITLTIPDAGNQAFYIQSQPKWLAFDQLQGSFRDGSVSLPYRFIDPGYQTVEGYYAAPLILCIKEKAYYQLDIWYGNFDTNPSVPDTTGNGGDPGNGGENPGNGEDSTIVNQGKTFYFDGTVVDAVYHKPSDRLVIATKNPDQLLVYNTRDESQSVVALSKVPNCLELTQDDQLLVGYTVAFVSAFQLDNMELLQTYTLDCIPFDLAHGDNDLCYVSPGGENDKSMRVLNLKTAELISKEFAFYHHFDEQTIIKKVKGEPRLLATRTRVSPSGLLLFDISEGIPNDTISYWHEGLINIWPTNDGKRFIDYRGNVFFIPEYNTQVTNSIDGFNQYGTIELAYANVSHVDENDATKRFFVATSDTWPTSSDYYHPSVIHVFDSEGLGLKRTLEPSTSVLNAQQTGQHFVGYVFSNQAGDKLFAIRRLTEEWQHTQWSVEEFNLDEEK
ncbi:hypothetical protein [uncultured Sunxiuqinia sp.]|uniref:hypothetical protein n=1 Tax=uncultured Sunxiuqinia sp. TaxID=1573825 RepID=UPI00260BD8C5|nr:hypothetical protein [uncultured Sunxiuqinia sp.]